MIVRFDNVSFKTNNSFYGVKNVNLEIQEGKSYGILAPPNNGKTSLVSLLCGLTSPSSGQIYFNEKKVSSLGAMRRKNIGTIFNENDLIKFGTILQNLVIVSQIGKFSIKKNDVVNILEIVGLDESYLNKEIHEISALDKKRVSFARALIKESKIIVVDNPTRSLEFEDVDKFINMLTSVCKERKISLIISTRSNYICKNLDHIFGINKGNVNYIK